MKTLVLVCLTMSVLVFAAPTAQAAYCDADVQPGNPLFGLFVGWEQTYVRVSPVTLECHYGDVRP